MIKCACGAAECKGNVRIADNCLWVESSGGVEVMIYLDANAKVAGLVSLQKEIDVIEEKMVESVKRHE
jgi:hypothetical protein